jgi:hypothetical protein
MSIKDLQDIAVMLQRTQITGQEAFRLVELLQLIYSEIDKLGKVVDDDRVG